MRAKGIRIDPARNSLMRLDLDSLKLEKNRTEIMVYLAFKKVGGIDTFYVYQAGVETRDRSNKDKYLFSISRGENDTIIVHPNYDADREWQRKFEVRRSPNTPAENQT